MHFIGIVGCFLFLYSPLCLLTAVSLRAYPQLLIIALFGAVSAYVSLLLTGILYTIVQNVRTEDHTNAISYVVVLIQVCTSILFRVMLFVFLYRLERFARGYGQLIAKSSSRFALTSAAVGCGMGMVSSLRGAGTLLDATRRLEFYTDGTTLYDFNICPQMPLLQHAVLQAFLLLLCHIAWAVMTGQGVVALLVRRDKRRTLFDPLSDTLLGTDDYSGDYPNRAADVLVTNYNPDVVDNPQPAGNAVIEGESPAAAGGEGLTSSGTAPAVVSEQEPWGYQLNQPQREEEEGTNLLTTSSDKGPKTQEVGDEERISEQDTGVDTQDDGYGPSAQQSTQLLSKSLQEPTVLHRAPTVAVASLVSAAALQLSFSLFSLLSTGAYNYKTMEEVPFRGCMVTLPAQAAITAASLNAMFGLLRAEGFGNNAVGLEN
ncbi:Aph-1 protein [Trypanosoma brucei equiperdum]|uniref:Aph-1 protein n=1 Tax=Trypanosoma brucei equiperdum TaxID=630700 RepID=A0A3L6L5I5_9TRYP|nr:Aph-1 protein [Trypanosoma brucei equiperdum]